MTKTTTPAKALKLLVLFYAILSISYWIFFLATGEGDKGLIAIYLDETKVRGFYWLKQAGNFSVPFSFIVIL